MRRIVAVAALVLTACTTVPGSSTPSIVQHLGDDASSQPSYPPPPRDADARRIVTDFLGLNAAGDPNHIAAKAYLTAEEKTSWPGSSVTIVDNETSSNPVKGVVTVTGKEIGTLDDNGVYTPSNQGDGTGNGGVPVSVRYGLTKISGQWRIQSLSQNGLLITLAQFQQYQQRAVYLLDAAGKRLVPDPRYTQLSDTRGLTEWLVGQLGQGPAQQSPLTTALPHVADAKRAALAATFAPKNDAAVSIEIAGASQLDGATRDELAAQVGATLQQVAQLNRITITDGGDPVRIPAAEGTSFAPGQLGAQFELSPPAPALYYVVDGIGDGIYDQAGLRLAGKVGNGVYRLKSVALATKQASDQLLVAGVRHDGVLDIGTQQRLTATTVSGALSRPAWVPGQDEVWVGDGSTLYRVSTAGVVQKVAIDAQNGAPSATITAVRLSPEGARVALVLTGTNNISQVYVGTVLPSGSTVRVVNLLPISPAGIHVSDVSWYDALKLFAIGTNLATGDYDIWEVQSDGSFWTSHPPIGLPGPPTSITVTSGANPVVSVGSTLWIQQAASWEGLLGDDSPGTNPVYVN